MKSCINSKAGDFKFRNGKKFPRNHVGRQGKNWRRASVRPYLFRKINSVVRRRKGGFWLCILQNDEKWRNRRKRTNNIDKNREKLYNYENSLKNLKGY